jgi:putative endonuclease
LIQRQRHYGLNDTSKQMQEECSCAVTLGSDLKQRLESHNSGGSIHTKHGRPWKLVMYLAFDTEEKALAFEKYIKVGSGYAFAKKRFW